MGTELDKSSKSSFNEYNKRFIIRIVLCVFHVIVGIFSNSTAFIADGINSIAYLPCRIDDGLEQKKMKLRQLFVYVFLLLIALVSTYIIIVSFFEMSATIGYKHSSPKLWVLVAIMASVLIKIYMLLNIKSKENIDESEEIFVEELSKLKFDIFSSFMIFASIILSYSVDFYFEPVVGLSLAVFTAFYSINILPQNKNLQKSNTQNENINNAQ